MGEKASTAERNDQAQIVSQNGEAVHDRMIYSCLEIVHIVLESPGLRFVETLMLREDNVMMLIAKPFLTSRL